MSSSYSNKTIKRQHDFHLRVCRTTTVNVDSKLIVRSMEL